MLVHSRGEEKIVPVILVHNILVDGGTGVLALAVEYISINHILE